MSKSSKTSEVVYECVCQKPGMCTYDMEKELNMSGGRVRHALSRLEKMGLISFRWVQSNPHFYKLSYPIRAKKLMPRKIFRQLKSFRF